MTPASPAGRRPAALACLLAAASTLALSACGSGGGASADDSPASAPRQRSQAVASGEPCPARATAFLQALDALRGQLAVGLSYAQYAAKVRALRASYDEIPIDRLGLGCLAATGTSAERAFNRYVDAANAWGACLADASCTTAAIEPVLQRQWRLASRFLAAAR